MTDNQEKDARRREIEEEVAKQAEEFEKSKDYVGSVALTMTFPGESRDAAYIGFPRNKYVKPEVASEIVPLIEDAQEAADVHSSMMNAMYGAESLQADADGEEG